jgi:hypothetical protein
VTSPPQVDDAFALEPMRPAVMAAARLSSWIDR